MSTSNANPGNLYVNSNIPGTEFRVIFPDGNTKVMTKREALDTANRYGLDLVMITNGNIPVTKIVDLGKFKFELQKKTRDMRKSQRENRVDIKDLRFRPVTDEHDINVKVSQARRFLTDGDKVRLVMKFRGRELSHKDMGRSLLSNILSKLPEYQVDGDITDTGRELYVIITPKMATKVSAPAEQIA